MITPKIDWNSEDYYNSDDLNRVEANIEYIANCIKNLQYNIPDLVINTNRNISSIDFLKDINRVENNIESIRKNFITPLNYEGSKIWEVGKGFSYKDANRLEFNIKKLYDLSSIVENNLIYCGTFSCATEWEGGLF